MKSCLSCGETYQSNSWLCPRCGWEPSYDSGITSFLIDDNLKKKGFISENFSILYAIEKKHFWFKSRNRIIIWAFKRFFKDKGAFLEIGCGTGFVLQAITSAIPYIKTDGSELFSEALRFSRERLPNSDLFQMNAEQIPFSREYDVIGAFDVLEHIDCDQKVLGNCYDALKSNGGIILTVPQHPSLWSDFDTRSCHVRRYTRKEIIEKISKAGFRIQYVSSFVTLLLPFMILSRLKTVGKEDEQVTVESSEIPRYLNFLFELVMVLEMLLLRIGVSLPFGGSLLVVAKKL